ncbi:MAG: 3-oxoacyl-ACP reductase FabG [Oscillospiraceae bacterium]|nr:3-oxoacyl-ACP reductase FabG [Oscillospiraceae bacterium]
MEHHTVLITGASRGIGAAAARLFAEQGWDVALGYQTKKAEAEALAAQLAALGVRAMAVGADVADAAQVDAMFAAVEGQLGPVDVLVNNAGIAQIGLFTDLTEEQWDRVMDVNCKGVYLCCRRALPAMIAAHRGSIINLSSMWGQVGASCEVAYSAAKAAVIGLTKALAKEVGPSGIRVNCVAPGVIATDMNAALTAEDIAALEEETPLCRIGTAQEAAQAILWLAGEKSAFVTGQVLAPNGGIVV